MAEDTAQPPKVTGIIGWFATNHVAANLIWVTVIGIGIYTLFNIKVEVFPSFVTDRIEVRMSYPGATPSEMEETITVKIEEAIEDIEGIDGYFSYSGEGSSNVNVSVAEGYDKIELTNEIKAAVDSISTFPPDAYPPRVGDMQMFKPQAISVQVSGDLDMATLKAIAENIRAEIVSLEEVSYAELNGVLPYEIRIEVSEQSLQQYGLTLEQVAQVIRRWSINVSSGSIDASGGAIRVRADGQAYTGEEYGDITILTDRDGTALKLRDIASIHDGFVDAENVTLFNGKPSIGIMAISRGEENDVDIANAVKQYVAQRSTTLPSTVSLDTWADASHYLKGHLTMMVKNLLYGGLLVFGLLSIFLHIRMAFWVVFGLPVAFLGAVIFMPTLDITICIPSLFGFIVVIGIVVDDAIIIAESAYAETAKSGYTVENIVKGAQRVAVPATFGVLTTVAAFGPLFFATGPIKNMVVPITGVVVLCLLFSLIESKLILPSHLALMKRSHGDRAGVTEWVHKQLDRFVENVYIPLVRLCMEFRYATLAFFSMLFLGATSLVLAQIVPFGFFPSVANDYIRGEIEVIDGAPEHVISDNINHMHQILDQLEEEFQAETGKPVIRNVYTYTRNEGRVARFQVELTKREERPLETYQVMQRWRERIGDLPYLKNQELSASQRMGSGSDLDLRLRGENISMLEAAGEELVEYLRSFSGLYNVQSTANSGPKELKLAVSPAGEAAGLTLGDLGRQVRYALYGVEVQRIQRGEDNLRVMVKYPKEERQSIGNLENMWVRLPNGSSAPFNVVAEYSEAIGYNSIRREDGARTLSISADVDQTQVSAQQVLFETERSFLPQLTSKYPGITSERSGTTRDEFIGIQNLLISFAFALITIYALMAVPLKSYVLPILIMSVIPFGIIGAILGHWIVKMLSGEPIQFNFPSMIGCIALSGVVVNDSLILVHYVKRKLAEGADLVSAIASSGKARFRAILLTSLTTFFGLVPIMLENSVQAKMIANMAISIAFGIMFATMITLILIPTLIRTLADLGWNKNALERPKPEDEPPLVPATAT